MKEYLIDVDDNFYGPYHSKEQARFAQYLFISKHPDMQESCAIVPLERSVGYTDLFEPQLLH